MEVSGVHFIAANTDVGALQLSQAPTKVTLGEKLTKGLGAGSDPEVGRNSAKESVDKIREVVAGADMVFLTAGMGGGTGTGASPIIAEVAKESGALVVAVVTFPFSFEMNRRRKQAMTGIATLKEKVDALLVVENDRLLELTDKKKNTLMPTACGQCSARHPGVTDFTETEPHQRRLCRRCGP